MKIKLSIDKNASLIAGLDAPDMHIRTAARPNDRVTDNRAAFHQRLDTLRSATRRTHLDEPTTDARVNA